MLSRRAFLAASAAPVAASLTRDLHALDTLEDRRDVQAMGMVLAMHQNTARAAGFRGSLEGWARAGIRYAELTDALLDGFLEDDTLAGARSLLDDSGITPVSAAAVMQDLWIPGPAHQEALETWRRRCEQFATLGLELIYCPSITNRPVTA
jgi:sugar phosphate isomerase/epimerase